MPLSKEDRDLFERAQSSLDPARREVVEEAMVKSFLQEKEAGYVAIKGKRDQVAIYELLGFKDPLDNYLRVPREAAELYRKLSHEMSLPDEIITPLEALEGSIGHTRVTAALSAAIANRMGLDDNIQKEVLLAAHYHDIGKLNIPERLLSDKRRLSDLPPTDQDLMRGHVLAAEKILQEMGVSLNPSILEAIRHHHERFDGSGYPEGLKGEQICLMARILHLADEYESLTAWRAYRDKREIPVALGELRSAIVEGKFDPKIGEIFLKMLDSSIGID